MRAGFLPHSIEACRHCPTPQVALLGFRPGMPSIHKFIGFAIVIGWGVLFLWGTAWWVRRREPAALFWRLLAVLQVLLGMQLVAGIEIILNRRRSMLPATRSGVAFRNAFRCSDSMWASKPSGERQFS